MLGRQWPGKLTGRLTHPSGIEAGRDIGPYLLYQQSGFLSTAFALRVSLCLFPDNTFVKTMDVPKSLFSSYTSE